MKSVMRVVNNQNGKDSVNTNLLDSAETYYVGIELDKALETLAQTVILYCVKVINSSFRSIMEL